MKKVFLTMLAAGTLASAQAQLWGPEAWNGAIWGTLIGGVAGSDRHHGFSGEGAAIGAGVGLLAGALVGEARRQEDYAGVPYYYAGPVSYPQPYVYYSPNAYCAPGYYYQPARPNYAVGGTLLGAASGALIGEGSGHNAGQGAAIGAAAGLVLGGAAELAAQHHERSVVASQPVPVALPAPPQTARRPGEPAARAFQASYMPQRYQISDAPRVPDAPTF